jgi:hypothetical protein
MTKTKNLFDLLEKIVNDNETFEFPVEDIQLELINLLMHQDEFEYFYSLCFKKLKKKYGVVIAHIFIQLAERYMDLENTDISAMELVDYMSMIEGFNEHLESVKITAIPSKSSDGEMMSAMS